MFSSSFRALPFVVLGLSCTLPACTSQPSQAEALHVAEAAVEYVRVQYITREPGSEAIQPAGLMIVSGELIGKAATIQLSATGAWHFAHVLANRLGVRAGRYNAIITSGCKHEVLGSEEGADCSFTDDVAVAISPSLPDIEGSTADIFVRWFYTFDTPSGEGELAFRKIRLHLERGDDGAWRVVDVPYYGG